MSCLSSKVSEKYLLLVISEIGWWSDDLMFNVYISPQEDSTDTEKRDILDLLKLSYIVVRTGIGTGQIMVVNIGIFL